MDGSVSWTEIDEGKGPAGATTTAERKEIEQLRRDLERLEQENAFSRKVGAFFAKEPL